MYSDMQLRCTHGLHFVYRGSNVEQLSITTIRLQCLPQSIINYNLKIRGMDVTKYADGMVEYSSCMNGIEPVPTLLTCGNE